MIYFSIASEEGCKVKLTLEFLALKKIIQPRLQFQQRIDQKNFEYLFRPNKKRFNIKDQGESFMDKNDI